MTSDEYRKIKFEKLMARVKAAVKKQFEHYYKVMGDKAIK